MVSGVLFEVKMGYGWHEMAFTREKECMHCIELCSVHKSHEASSLSQLSKAGTDEPGPRVVSQ